MKKVLKEGDVAPNFEVISTEGNFSLYSVENKNIVLYFYPKDMTPGCSIQAREFTELYSDFRKNDTIVIGVSKDSISSHNKFCDKENIPYILLSDQESFVSNLYDIIKEKSMFGKKYFGISRSTFLISKNKKIVAIWKNVKASGHALKVLHKVISMNAVQNHHNV